MAKTSAIQRNLKRIRLNKRYSKKRIELKKIIKNKKIPLSERFSAQLKLNKLPKNSSKIRIRNRCEITGRPHGVYRKLKISRIALREMASSGIIVTGILPGGFTAPGNAMERLQANKPEVYESFVNERLPRKKMGNVASKVARTDNRVGNKDSACKRNL